LIYFNNMIPYGKQNISIEDIDAVVKILKSDFLTQGPTVPLFEKAITKYVNADFAIATNSSTSCLHIACMALELGKGDTLWTSPNSFVASSNAAIYCGAEVDFVDIDPITYNMSIECLEQKLIKAKKLNKLPKVVMPVHFAGQSCEMKIIFDLAKEYGFKIIEDASHAIGASYMNKKVGCCEYSDITVFSFHPVKIITTGEGGVAVTNNPDLAERMIRFRSHGITSNRDYMSESPEDEIWNYQQISIGYNYRMTDIQAALGLSQMNRLDEFVLRRQQIAKKYDQSLAELPIILPNQILDSYSSYHLYPIRIRKSLSGNTQKIIYEYLTNTGIIVNLHYIPIYLQPYYKAKGFQRGYCKEAELYFTETITLPIYPDLDNNNQNFIIDTLKKIILFKAAI
jgi:UDP-4-amino-4,6-dideoxy-N-acetyl-beta-L-altrosamine transaminase